MCDKIPHLLSTMSQWARWQLTVLSFYILCVYRSAVAVSSSQYTHLSKLQAGNYFDAIKFTDHYVYMYVNIRQFKYLETDKNHCEAA
jgi:hypothetical protein